VSRFGRAVARATGVFLAALMVAGLSSGVTAAQTATPGAASGLAAVKQYAIEHATAQKAATEQLVRFAGRYYDLAEGTGFDYQALWDSNTPEVAGLLAASKRSWLEASTHYEMSEGLIAGIPSLAYYDVWIDAGPSGEEDAAGALDWTLELPNGETLEKPGNIYHHLTEPIVWGTDERFVGLELDIDGDGQQELGEVLPEANVFLASSQALDTAAGEMLVAVNEWDPTIEDAFTALVTMIPTMSEYFEQWKLSSFVTGETSTEKSFVATSRLFDVNGILTGLKLTYDEVGSAVEKVDPELHRQIAAGFEDLTTFVADLYQQEVDGKRFTPDEADLFGSEAQAKATALAGQVSQAIALLGLQV
jgi:Imelysin